MTAPSPRARSPVVLSAVLGAVVGYSASYLFGLPRPLYLPVERTWRMTAGSGILTMGWYGLILWGLAGALAGACLAAIPRVERLWRRRMAAWALPAIALGILLVIAGHELARWLVGRPTP